MVNEELDELGRYYGWKYPVLAASHAFADTMRELENASRPQALEIAIRLQKLPHSLENLDLIVLGRVVERLIQSDAT